MMLPIIAIRPEPGCAATVAAGQALGLAIEPHPLFAIVPCAWHGPDAAGIDALLIGSANAFRHGGAGLEQYRGRPAHVVGQATADAARAAGFVVAGLGHGGLQQVLDTVPPGLVLLRLAGEDHVPLAAPAGVRIVTRVAYASRARQLSAALATRLAAGALVLLHSAAAAAHLAAECDRCGVPRGAVRLAALGPRIAQAAGVGWADLRSAAEPRDASLLALAQEMCH